MFESRLGVYWNDEISVVTISFLDRINNFQIEYFFENQQQISNKYLVITNYMNCTLLFLEPNLSPSKFDSYYYVHQCMPPN